MEILEDDVNRIKSIWIAVFKKLLNWSPEQVDEWMNEFGDHLLKDTSLMHEEPWYWILPWITAEFTNEKKTHLGKTEAEVFRLLYDTLGKPLDEINWYELRKLYSEFYGE